MENEAGEVPHYSKIPVGSSVSIVTSVRYKYEGVVVAVNSIENTITLQNVKFLGTEGRTSENAANQSTESNGPAVGSLFESVTFWMSSVIKLSVINDPKVKNELGDNAVKTANSVEEKKPTPNKQNTISGDSVSSAHYSNKETTKERKPNRGPRQITYGNRRGRNSGASRQPFVVYNAGSVQVPSGGRGRFVAPISEFPAYRPKEGRQGRRSRPPGGRNRVSYPQDTRNGGMIVYLPPEVATVYRTNGVNVLPQSSFSRPRSGGRRRNYERRNGPPRGAPAKSDLDTTKPYDFETANAELAAELAKINLESENAERQATPNSGDRQVHLSSESGVNFAGKTSDSGASGDSSTGVVTVIRGGDIDALTAVDGIRTLSRGEFYVREKCFFDQISRSEGGPRGPTGGVKGERGRLNRENNLGQGNSGRSDNGSSMSNARRERQLNIETFGPMATRSIYNQRRRPTGSVPRDLLVSATA
ncbi:unnamed protein product [Mesocestoides corti]|uniref:FFD box profile domain-containing protein n=2 Tax=Mesocestoides corti TaxID=53468 RepID=A0A0R3U5E6_MESCO|nr:unnamed protein product [Mesocestoides corti]